MTSFHHKVIAKFKGTIEQSYSISIMIKLTSLTILDERVCTVHWKIIQSFLFMEDTFGDHKFSSITLVLL